MKIIYNESPYRSNRFFSIGMLSMLSISEFFLVEWPIIEEMTVCSCSFEGLSHA